jgi:hypothetical protein
LLTTLNEACNIRFGPITLFEEERRIEMRSRRILPLLVICMLFLTAGVAFAVPMPHDAAFEFKNSNGDLGARVYVDVVEPVAPDNIYTYLYQVENVYFDPASNNAPGTPANEINLLMLSVAIPLDSAGWLVPAGKPEAFVDEISGQVWFGFYYTDTVYGTVGILEGELSDIFFIKSTFGPGEGLATLFDSGESINENVISGLVTPGGGPGEVVPEPGTLFLVGSGLLGLGCLRVLIRARRKSRS